MAEFSDDIEQKHLYLLIALLIEHPGHSKGVAAVVAGTGDDNYSLARKKPRYNLARHSTRRPLQKIDRVYLLGLARGAVYFPYKI